MYMGNSLIEKRRRHIEKNRRMDSLNRRKRKERSAETEDRLQRLAREVLRINDGQFVYGTIADICEHVSSSFLEGDSGLIDQKKLLASLRSLFHQIAQPLTQMCIENLGKMPHAVVLVELVESEHFETIISDKGWRDNLTDFIQNKLVPRDTKLIDVCNLFTYFTPLRSFRTVSDKMKEVRKYRFSDGGLK